MLVSKMCDEFETKHVLTSLKTFQVAHIHSEVKCSDDFAIF